MIFYEYIWQRNIYIYISSTLYRFTLALYIYIYIYIYIYVLFIIYIYINIFYILYTFSRTFTNHRTAGEGGGHFFNSSLPLPPASQTLRHQTGDYCRELTSAHSQQPDSNREPLVSERKSSYASFHVFNHQVNDLIC